MSYGDFHTLVESDTSFKHWFVDMEADAIDLATGPMWQGEGPFPVGYVILKPFPYILHWQYFNYLMKRGGYYLSCYSHPYSSFLPTLIRRRWTRVLLLQQLLVELMDLLDPDCVRLPLDRRQRLMPINWGRLPRVTEYQQRLKELSNSSGNFLRHNTALEGLRDLMKGPSVDEPPLTSSLRSVGENKVGLLCTSGSFALSLPPQYFCTCHY